MAVREPEISAPKRDFCPKTPKEPTFHRAFPFLTRLFVAQNVAKQRP
jgi:hypothetical protein